jgi:hypothetical protein
MTFPPAPAKCRSCSAAIYWAKTKDGTTMPVDAEPAEDGNLVLSMRPWGSVEVRPWVPEMGPAFKRRRSHFATCRDADAWRKKQGNLNLEGA